MSRQDLHVVGSTAHHGSEKGWAGAQRHKALRAGWRVLVFLLKVMEGFEEIIGEIITHNIILDASEHSSSLHGRCLRG